MKTEEFEHIFGPIRKRMLAMAVLLVESDDDAEDIVQETMLKLWALRDKLDSVASPVAFAMTIARNKGMDMLRSRRPGVDLSALDRFGCDDLTAEESIIAQENLEEVDRIMAGLSEPIRNILRMRHVDGLSSKDIADIIGVKETTVRVMLSRARKRVREMFNA